MIVPDVAKTALITGAGRGLGAAIAASLFERGYRLVLTDRDEAAAQAQAASLDPSAQRAVGLELDVCQKSHFERALKHVEQLWGGVGVLVSNAALTKTTPIYEISPEEFDQVIQVNLRGVFLGCQVFGAAFQAQGYGRIINLGSLAAQNGGAATGAHYAASKGGIITLTKVFARDLAAFGVTVNAIAPGPLDVELVREILPPEKLASVQSSIPVGQLGDPAFIGEVVSLLAGPSAASITGATIDANGGLYVR